MATIKISDLTSFALTEKDGITLREVMQSHFEKDEKIALDFSGVSLFASMFFNASIGYFILKYSPEVALEKIDLINISPLGEETFEHSKVNATEIYRAKLDVDKIESITNESIMES